VAPSVQISEARPVTTIYKLWASEEERTRPCQQSGFLWMPLTGEAPHLWPWE